MNIYPWEKGVKPQFVNKEGYEWYIDKNTTQYCTAGNDRPPLDALAFLVAKEGALVGRVLIDKNTNEVLADDSSLEGIGVKIDVLREFQNNAR